MRSLGRCFPTRRTTDTLQKLSPGRRVRWTSTLSAGSLGRPGGGPRSTECPLSRYLGKGISGTEKLLEGFEAENERIKISSVVRWLGRAADIKITFNEGVIDASSATSAVLGGATFACLRVGGLRLLGRRYAFGEIRPDAFCGRCRAWGHIEAQCSVTVRCALREGGQQTTSHRRPVEGPQVKKGQTCSHVVAKRRNCRSLHFAQANVCLREGEREAEGRWLLSLPRG